MSAVRVARAFTGRDRDRQVRRLLSRPCRRRSWSRPGSGATTLGIPTSPGVPSAVTADTLLARYNDLASVDALCS